MLTTPHFCSLSKLSLWCTSLLFFWSVSPSFITFLDMPTQCFLELGVCPGWFSSKGCSLYTLLSRSDNGSNLTASQTLFFSYESLYSLGHLFSSCCVASGRMRKCYPAKILQRSFSLIKTKSPSWDVHDLAFLSFGAWFSFQLAVYYRIQLQRKRSVSQEAHLSLNSFLTNLASMAALKASSQSFQGKLVFQDSLFLSEFCTPFSILQLFSFVFISIIMINISFIASVLHY